MQLLPTEREQHWLLVSLKDLIKARGHDHFFAYPIVEPTRKFFPDRWSFSPRGLDRVVRRLMQYAALGHLDARVEPFSDAEDLPTGSSATCRDSVAGLFLGIENGRCLFGFNTEAPADEEYMAGVLCHEVAHAYRSHHGLAVDDANEEELLTDLTACYLGFGVLTANNSYRYRTSAELVGSFAYRQESAHRTGYLTAQAFCYLLGLQMVMRDLDPRQRKQLLRHLEPNQAAFAYAAFRECQSRARDFPLILGVPPPDRRPGPRPLATILVPLPNVAEPEPVVEAARLPAHNVGYPVFRVRRTRALGHALLGLLVGSTIGVWLSVVASHPLWVVAPILVGPYLGALVGRRRAYDMCSDPGCSAVVPEDVQLCPGCGGTVSGRIASQDARLEAEERLETRTPAP